MLSIVSSATSALIPLVVGVAIDTFVFPSGGQTQWPPLLFAAVFAAAFIVPVLGEIIFLGLLYFLFHSKFPTLMRRHIHKHLQGLSWRYYQNEFAGRIVQEGSHDKLVAEPGLYAELWARQAGGFG